jgi:hypothetical protein
MAMRCIDWGLDQHRHRVADRRVPVTDARPTPKPGSDREWRQLAAIWKRTGEQIKAAVRGADSVATAHLSRAAMCQSPPRIGWERAVEIAAGLKAWRGVVWLAADDGDELMLDLGDGSFLGAALCWWAEGDLTLACFGAGEPDLEPFLPLLPVSLRSQSPGDADRLESHEIVVTAEHPTPVARHDLTRGESRVERMGRLACRLALVSVGLLGELQAIAGDAPLGPPPLPPVTRWVITDTAGLSAAIVERWVARDELALGWRILDLIHEELFAGRELTPLDYAAVEEAMWGIYETGANIYGPDTWHMILRGGPAPLARWCEPWFPEPQRSASERYAHNPSLQALLSAGRVPAGANARELRRLMPFGFRVVASRRARRRPSRLARRSGVRAGQLQQALHSVVGRPPRDARRPSRPVPRRPVNTRRTDTLGCSDRGFAIARTPQRRGPRPGARHGRFATTAECQTRAGPDD